MNENEIERIAAMGNALRPDWPLSSLRTLLARPELTHRTRRDVAVALAWVACESTTKTPARVIEAGPWWIATNANGQRGHTSLNIPCPNHAGETLPCGKCAHDRVPADDNPALALARAQLASARANLCSHGVPHRACTDHRTKPEPAATEETE